MNRYYFEMHKILVAQLLLGMAFTSCWAGQQT